MWFTFVTARLFIFLSFQPRLTATLLRSCSVVNNPIRRMGLAPMFKPASPAQASFASVTIQALVLAASRVTGIYACWVRVHNSGHLNGVKPAFTNCEA